MKVARRADLDPFVVMEMVRAARERTETGADVLHMEVGQPSTGAPGTAVEAARRALDAPEQLGYTDAPGLPSLRRRIAAHHAERHGVVVDPDHIVVTEGASLACVLAFLAAFDVGDRVAVCEPGYPCYRQMLRALGCEVVPVPIGQATRYQPTPELLDAAGPLDGLVLASPSNPTGTVLSSGELAALADWATRAGCRLVSDEIYHGITYGEPAPTALAHPSARPIAVHSFSKYFSMTGWRLGWLVLPPELVRPVELLAQNLVISAPTLSQIAGEAALGAAAELDLHVDRYRTNRSIVLDGLARMGCTDVAPADGAFYAYADVSHLLDPHGLPDSVALCTHWLETIHVATTPGIDFDQVRGAHTMRWSFAGSTSTCTEAMRRLVEWCDRRLSA